MADRMCLTLFCSSWKGGLHVELARRFIITNLSLKKIPTQVQWITQNHLFTNNVKYFIWYMYSRGIWHLCFHTSNFDIAGWFPLTARLVAHIWILVVSTWFINGLVSAPSQYLHQFRFISCHGKRLLELDSDLWMGIFFFEKICVKFSLEM